MIINHAGNLKKDYFLSYMRLIMNARQCNVEDAKDYIFQSMFGLQDNSLGEKTYQNFLDAYQELKQPN
ncbi:hypothetical protein BWGOE4_18840 [Bacillus mycoides]|uniref:Uncharacterized protein n=1 Tax=Bacillus mycoides TaxID=1405 RepID=A0A1E8BQ19_BACMY|nr:MULTISPECIES: hypothetical protein [Bacillus]MBJ8069110.1 hypothetical protein [Bacillus cereus]EJV61726.1 hypothetical protein IEM_03481 [Bacillus cereus BAG6O-2]KMN45233.1 hypothetical protein VK90_11480 [Bacillus sp. LK2]MBJ8186685.1 hypothetical protein [Bacillus cereus]OFD44578.1 hypothetical protein BWGOE2_18390 [Bacillus mycoides]